MDHLLVAARRRCLHDVHVAGAHTALHPSNYEVCSAVLLGLPPPRVLQPFAWADHLSGARSA